MIHYKSLFSYSQNPPGVPLIGLGEAEVDIVLLHVLPELGQVRLLHLGPAAQVQQRDKVVTVEQEAAARWRISNNDTGTSITII